MAEKKVFKNVACVTGAHYERRVHLLDGDALEDKWAADPFSYNPSEWDLEVTLTRKVPKLGVGSRVRSKYMNSSFVFTVLAQWKDTVVAVDEEDDEINHFDTDEIILL